MLCHSIQWVQGCLLLQHGSTTCCIVACPGTPSPAPAACCPVCAGEPAFDFPMTTFYGTRDRRITEAMVQVG